LKNLLLSVTAVLAITSTAIGAPTATSKTNKVVLSPGALAAARASASAKSELTRLAEALGNAKGLSYASELSFATRGPVGAVTSSTTTKVTVERPAKFSVQTSSNSKPLTILDSTGSNVVIYDASAGKYAQESASSDIKSTGNALDDAARTLFGQRNEAGDSLQAALRFPISFLSGQVFLESAPAGVSIHFSSTPSTLNGKLVHSVVETINVPQRGSAKLTFVVDPTTNLPVSESEQEIPLDKTIPTVTVFKETFSNFRILSGPADTSAYAFLPPATATQVAIAPPPSDTPAPPDSPAAPGATTPTTPAPGAAPPTPTSPTAAPTPTAPAPTAPGAATPPAPPI